PLSEYFISSSHNTYLIGSQFQGQSSVEGYIRALQQGCRSVEVDVWDGDNGEPAVTHGHTLTSKIPVRTVLQAIAQYAFLASPYPVILSVEVHCELQQQEKLVSILHETLGNRLVSKRLDEMEADDELDKLPSPAQLKGRFLLKVSPRAAVLGTSSRSSIQQIPSASLAAPPNLLGSQLSASPPLLSSAFTNPSMTAPLPTSPRIKDMPMSQELAKLLVYTVGVKGRGFNKKESYPATHVVSLSESNLSKMLRDEATRQDFVSHNRTHLVRAYPRGRRLTSTNFVPHHMWSAGIQLVALNWQTFDIGMELNAAMFARAGRCGYVLKPEYLRKKGAEKDKVAALRSTRYRLELEIISAQQLPRPRGST
ncbi:PLC-like phosphodiesterase, partial [Rhodotorula sp. JG-1b]